MPKLYNQRDIMQECSKRIKGLQAVSQAEMALGPLKTIQLFIIIFTMLGKLAEYKSVSQNGTN